MSENQENSPKPDNSTLMLILLSAFFVGFLLLLIYLFQGVIAI
jgi:hypothetical protein